MADETSPALDEIWRCHAPGSAASLRLTPQALVVAGDSGVAVRHPWSAVGRVELGASHADLYLPGGAYRVDSGWGDWRALAQRVDDVAAIWADAALRQRRAKRPGTFDQAVGLAPGEAIRWADPRWWTYVQAVALFVGGLGLGVQAVVAGRLDIRVVLIVVFALVGAPCLVAKAWRHETRRLVLSHHGLFVDDWGRRRAYAWDDLLGVAEPDAIRVRFGHGTDEVFVGVGTDAQRRLLEVVRRSVQARRAGFRAPGLPAVPDTALSRLGGPEAAPADRALSRSEAGEADDA